MKHGSALDKMVKKKKKKNIYIFLLKSVYVTLVKKLGPLAGS